MQTNLSREFQDTAAGRLAGDILHSCVHCGFCNAVCPTCGLLGDECATATDRRRDAVFQPLDPALQTLHLRLKHAFDPQGIFNPGRLYREI